MEKIQKGMDKGQYGVSSKIAEEEYYRGKSIRNTGLDRKRKWSYYGEIVLLEALVDNGGEVTEVYDFFPGFSHKQVSNKASKLKSEFYESVGKGREKRSRFEPHKKRLYELSKQIWGDGYESSGETDSNFTKICSFSRYRKRFESLKHCKDKVQRVGVELGRVKTEVALLKRERKATKLFRKALKKKIREEMAQENTGTEGTSSCNNVLVNLSQYGFKGTRVEALKGSKEDAEDELFFTKNRVLELKMHLKMVKSYCLKLQELLEKLEA